MSLSAVFLTNQASYHQMDFARAMVAELGADNFRIVFQKPTSNARAEMGWQDDYPDACIIRWWESEASQVEAQAWIDRSDVVLQGRFPIQYVRTRISSGGLTFACQERLWKRPPTWLRKLSRFAHLSKNYYSVDVANYHFFAIGAFAAQDLQGLGVFADRMWQFGYFINVPEYPVRSQKSNTVEILWCARLSAVKQPLTMIKLIKSLRDKQVDCRLTLVGDGELRVEVESEIDRLGLSSSVTMLGWQSQDQVREHMASADLFVMTSHHGEGWGMVVNEAMSYGCCVLANKQLGAAAWLVQDGETGLLYDEPTLPSIIDQLASMTRRDLHRMGRAGHRRMQTMWSAEVAAKRTTALTQALLDGDLPRAKLLFNDGPCAPL